MNGRIPAGWTTGERGGGEARLSPSLNSMGANGGVGVRRRRFCFEGDVYEIVFPFNDVFAGNDLLMI